MLWLHIVLVVQYRSVSVTPMHTVQKILNIKANTNALLYNDTNLCPLWGKLHHVNNIKYDFLLEQYCAEDLSDLLFLSFPFKDPDFLVLFVKWYWAIVLQVFKLILWILAAFWSLYILSSICTRTRINQSCHGCDLWLLICGHTAQPYLPIFKGLFFFFFYLCHWTLNHWSIKKKPNPTRKTSAVSTHNR